MANHTYIHIYICTYKNNLFRSCCGIFLFLFFVFVFVIGSTEGTAIKKTLQHQRKSGAHKYHQPATAQRIYILMYIHRHMSIPICLLYIFWWTRHSVDNGKMCTIADNREKTMRDNRDKSELCGSKKHATKNKQQTHIHISAWLPIGNVLRQSAYVDLQPRCTTLPSRAGTANAYMIICCWNEIVWFVVVSTLQATCLHAKAIICIHVYKPTHVYICTYNRRHQCHTMVGFGCNLSG